MPRCSMQFFGDIALERGVDSEQAREKVSRAVEWLSLEVPASDIRVVNWEAPFRGVEGQHPMEKPIVTACQDSAETFLKFRVDVATLANNHIFDHKSSGLKNTVDFLNRRSVKTVGAGATQEQAYAPLHMDSNGIPLTFLAYVGEDTNPPPEEPGMYVSIMKPKKVLDATTFWANRGRKVIVIFHWGLENEAYPSPEKRELARQVVEAGACMVVCHHAHRLQGHEKWMHGHIFYGLGNFLFGIGYRHYVWPFYTNATAVAFLEIVESGVQNAGLLHFEQVDTVFSRTDPKTARKFEEKLNWPLRLSDSQYRLFWKLYNVYHLLFEKPFEAFQRRGFKAVFKINMDHLRSLTRLFFGKKSR